MPSFYFTDRNLRDRVISTIAMCAIMIFLIGPWFKPQANQCDFLLVLGSIPRPDRLFQASVIHGLCHNHRNVILMDPEGQKSTKTHKNIKLPYFDKSSAMISKLVNKTWFSHYPCCQHIIYDNGSEFKLHFKALCESFGIKHKPPSVKNPTVNAILEQVHQVISTMLCTAELDMADTVVTSDIDVFLTDAAWAIC